MKVAFVSNYFNHHQKPFSEAMYRLTNGQYRFIATSAMRAERINLGYQQDDIPEYVCLSYENNEYMEDTKKWIMEADIVIAGSTPEGMIRNRIKAGKIVFRYSERPLKNGLQIFRYPVRFLKWHIKNPPGKPIYLLAASGYAAGDYAKFGLFRSKAYRWGYFPETRRYDRVDDLLYAKQPRLILWCGRFLDCKHPDDVLCAVKRLRDDGYNFQLHFIGMGPMEEYLREQIASLKLEDHVQLLGSMKPDQVRRSMEQAGVYVFSSDKQEGWGAVLNEAMNSGCAVVASHAVGSVPFLVQDGENGLVYQSENIDMLYKKLRYLLDNPKEQIRLGKAAYETITKEWNAEIAAERFLELSKNAVSCPDITVSFESGPCSVAN